MPVVVTAGHVDHGKSTLINALTGQVTDRLAEEKSRGLTIDLGFSWMGLESGGELAFVDVPGHEKFMGNMLAGAGLADACLFVVSAREKMMPQSWEHLHILNFLGLGAGVVALTMSAELVAEELLEVEAEIRENLKGSFLEGAEVLKVDAPQNMGVDELKASLNQLAQKLSNTSDSKSAKDKKSAKDNPRLWVDRSFVASGSGTVVTGTLTLGHLEVGQELDLLLAKNLPAKKMQKKVKVRAIQSLGKERKRVSPSSRVALNLSGISKEEVGRGDVLVRSQDWFKTKTFDASLEVLPNAHEVTKRGSYHVYLGSGDFLARIAVLRFNSVAPGAHGQIRIFLDVELPLKPGDRYVLRDAGRRETIGGGEILDLDPQLNISKAEPDKSIERLLSERGGWVNTQELDLLTHIERAGAENIVELGDFTALKSAVEEVLDGLQEQLKNAGQVGLEVSSLAEFEQQILAAPAHIKDLPSYINGLKIEKGRAYLAKSQDTSNHPYLEMLNEAPFAPPAPAGHIERDLLREFVRQGLVMDLDGIFFSTQAVESAKLALAELLTQNPEGATVSEIKTKWETSRKYALSLLKYFDENGITRRRGDVRLPGPRL